MKKLISLILVAITVLSITGCKPELKGGQPDAPVVSNGGIVTKQGDWIYYINGAMPSVVSEALADTDRARIYRMKADGSHKQAVTDKKAYDMHIYGDKIFYTSPSEKEVILYSININGKGNKKIKAFQDSEFIFFGENAVIIENKERIFYYDYETLTELSFATGNIDSAKVSENYIYFCADNGNGINRIGIKTGRREVIADKVGLLLYATDEIVYFVSTRIPYRVNTNTLELVQISEAHYRKTYLDMEKRYLVCVLSDEADSGLFLQPIDNVAGQPVGQGGNKPRLQVHLKSAWAITTTKDYIFFVEEQTGDVYRMTFEGKDKVVLGKVPSVRDTVAMEVIDDTLYIMDDATGGKIYSVKTDGSDTLKIIKE